MTSRRIQKTYDLFTIMTQIVFKFTAFIIGLGYNCKKIKLTRYYNDESLHQNALQKMGDPNNGTTIMALKNVENV